MILGITSTQSHPSSSQAGSASTVMDISDQALEIMPISVIQAFHNKRNFARN
jgi:hypothetical protein